MTDANDKNKQDTRDLSAVVQFDLGEFEQRLAGVHQEYQEELGKSKVHQEPVAKKFDLNFNIPDAAPVAPKPAAKKIVDSDPLSQSGLLASLAQEAQQSQHSRDARTQNRQESNHRVHEALDRVLKFLLPFIQHVNTVEPAINRVYKLDARSIFDKLKWQGAKVDSRKQGFDDESLLSYVTFSVNLLAPEPVQLKRPWSQYEAVVKELNHFKITPMDDLHALHKRPQTEWLEARLEPALPVQIHFQGNYEQGKVDVLTRNLQDFGQTVFRLEPTDITVQMLEALGLFLIARSDKLPQQLQATPK